MLWLEGPPDNQMIKLEIDNKLGMMCRHGLNYMKLETYLI